MAAKKIDKGLSEADKLKLARKLAKRGKSSKYIVKLTGLPRSEVKAIQNAVDGVQQRKSDKQLLEEMRTRLYPLLKVARITYRDNPSGYNAGAISTLSGEVRALTDAIEEKQEPERLALELMRSSLQPLVTTILRDVTTEARRARTLCLAQARDETAEREVRLAFDDFLRNSGRAAKGRYGESAERMALALRCDLEALRSLAAKEPLEDTQTAASTADEGREDVIPLRIVK